MKLKLKGINAFACITVSLFFVTTNSAAVTIEFSVASDNNTPESAVANALTIPPNQGVCGRLQTADQSEQILTPDQSHMLGFCNALSAVSETDTFSAYKALSARSFSSLTSFTANGFNSLDIGDIAKRLASLRKSSARLTRKSVSMFDYEYPADNLASLYNQNNLSGGGASADETGDLYDNRLSAFATGTFSNSEQEETNTLAGYKSNINSIFIGLDYRFTSQVFAGIAIKSLIGEVDLIENAGSVDVTDNSLSVYGSYYPNEKMYLQGTLTYGQGSYDITRKIDFTLNNTPFNEIANSNPDGDGLGFSISGGYDHNFSNTGLTTVADITFAYAKTNIDGFTESNAKGFNLIVDEQLVESLSSKASIQITKAISTSFGVLLPEFAVSWKHEFKVDGSNINAAFAIDPAQTFSYTTDERESDYFILSLANSFILPRGITGFIQFEQVLGIDAYDTSAINIGARFEF